MPNPISLIPSPLPTAHHKPTPIPMAMASPTLMNPATTAKSVPPMINSKLPAAAATPTSTIVTPAAPTTTRRRDFLAISAGALVLLSPVRYAWAVSDDEYVKETEEVISKVRTTLTMDKTAPNIADAVADLRETSNSWVAKYRREKSLLGRASFRDMYSALNAVSGHYISFGPTAPIPAKRRQRILEEMDTAEKALLRGR